jgi:O-antigen/teichoic acid export membrane protein
MEISKTPFFFKYIKIYIWQFFAFIVRFFSMFVVLPFLTKNQTTYGVYALCISVNIFFGYADLGFMRSGQKFASENIKNENRKEEMKYIGFSTFILLIFTIIIALIIFLISFNPTILLKGVEDPRELSIASKLLLILSIFTPVAVFQRMISMIYEIRIENYINQKVFLIANIFTILSVFYYFRKDNYDIVNYFFFSQFLNFLSVLICFIIAKKKYEYDFKALFRMIKFNKEVYNKRRLFKKCLI